MFARGPLRRTSRNRATSKRHDVSLAGVKANRDGPPTVRRPGHRLPTPRAARIGLVGLFVASAAVVVLATIGVSGTVTAVAWNRRGATVDFGMGALFGQVLKPGPVLRLAASPVSVLASAPPTDSLRRAGGTIRTSGAGGLSCTAGTLDRASGSRPVIHHASGGASAPRRTSR